MIVLQIFAAVYLLLLIVWMFDQTSVEVREQKLIKVKEEHKHAMSLNRIRDTIFVLMAFFLGLATWAAVAWGGFFIGIPIIMLYNAVRNVPLIYRVFQDAV